MPNCFEQNLQNVKKDYDLMPVNDIEYLINYHFIKENNWVV